MRNASFLAGIATYMYPVVKDRSTVTIIGYVRRQLHSSAKKIYKKLLMSAITIGSFSKWLSSYLFSLRGFTCLFAQRAASTYYRHRGEHHLQGFKHFDAVCLSDECLSPAASASSYVIPYRWSSRRAV